MPQTGTHRSFALPATVTRAVTLAPSVGRLCLLALYLLAHRLLACRLLALLEQQAARQICRELARQVQWRGVAAAVYARGSLLLGEPTAHERLHLEQPPEARRQRRARARTATAAAAAVHMYMYRRDPHTGGAGAVEYGARPARRPRTADYFQAVRGGGKLPCVELGLGLGIGVRG